ncbi:uncharacterized protein [Solanum tuberosum]|uniref:uncharacterized protein n=1 Tax=Solanum tuberosum TaxID=4113 RepID=UPI00073A4258|nr:PREDICTED: uncharacterized protein LOC107060460 [Solanum tuberosum]
MARRTTLIRSTLNGLANHVMQFTILPKQDLTNAPPMDWIPKLIKQSGQTPISPVPSATPVCFGLWINRNNNHFNHTNKYPDYRQPMQRAIEFHSLGPNYKPSRIPISIDLSWSPPTNGFKLNTDGACSQTSTQKGGFGGVIRDSAGSWIIGFMGSVQNTSPLATEMLALFHCLRIAQLHNIQPLEIEMDAQAVVHRSTL